MKIWFLLNNGQVTGPMTAEELEAQLVKAPETTKDALVWGRGQSEWTTPDKWRKLPQVSRASQNSEPSQQQWRLRIEGRELPPQSFPDMIKQLKKITDYSVVEVKSESSHSWREVYAYQQIVDDLGISRRSHPRVPIMGTLEYESNKGKFTGKAISISEGGLGITEAKGLVIGERIRATLKSPNLFVTLSVNCDVVYVGNEGYAGLKFSNLPSEAKSSIIEYVNKFSL